METGVAAKLEKEAAAVEKSRKKFGSGSCCL
jgi:hypothetical protein